MNCKINDSKRKSNRLGSIRLHFVRKGTIDHFQDKEKKKSNAAQYKYRSFQKDEVVFNKVLKKGCVDEQ